MTEVGARRSVGGPADGADPGPMPSRRSPSAPAPSSTAAPTSGA